jgi:hypothetical protein
VPTVEPTVAFDDYVTYGYDNARDEYNPNTSAITPSSIAHLHLAWQVAVGDGASLFQPLVLTNVVPGHPVALVVGGYETIYAYDALAGGSVIWQTTLPGQNLQNCGTAGVSGTAVYDANIGGGVIFVADGNGASMNPSHVVLYELSAATGSQIASVDVTPYLVNGEAVSSHTAVTLANGMLYLGTGSSCEGAPPPWNPNWLGRIVAVNPNTMTIADTFFETYGQGGLSGGGGVWGWGGVSADGSGNIYSGSGNAETASANSYQTPAPPVLSTTTENTGYAEHLVKLSSNLQTLEGSDAPTFNFAVGYGDLDYPGSPTLFQPPIGSGCSDLLSGTMGKGGLLVINDTTSLSEVDTYQLSIPSGNAFYIGNPAYSPALGYLFAPISSSGTGGAILPPGLAAIGPCGNTMVWHDQFGPDSSQYTTGDDPRSVPAVTAGGVVFVGTPCTPNAGNTNCTTPSGSAQGALWAINASTGTVLNGGNPIVITGDNIRMAATTDADWVWVFDTSGNLYGYTIDPSVPAVAVHRANRRPRPYRIEELPGDH